jgi:hypothetical protein
MAGADVSGVLDIRHQPAGRKIIISYNYEIFHINPASTAVKEANDKHRILDSNPALGNFLLL